MQGGPYANLFDNAEDTLTLQRVQCFDFEGLDKYPLLLAPLLFYVLHRASAAIHDPAAASQLKLFVLDEAWRFAQDATVQGVHHGGAEDLAQAQRRDDPRHAKQRGLPRCRPPPHRRGELSDEVLLGESEHGPRRARELFHLNHTEAALIQHLRPRQQALLKRPDLSKVINLHVEAQAGGIDRDTLPDVER